MTAGESARFTRTFTAEPHHIDELGHVNNAVWVQWIQDLATAHWDAAARPADHAAFFWVVIRHEIDYRGNIAAGERAHGTTFIDGPPRGAKSVRVVEFVDAAGKPLVSARTTWAMLDRTTQRLARVRAEVIAPFVPESCRARRAKSGDPIGAVRPRLRCCCPGTRKDGQPFIHHPVATGLLGFIHQLIGARVKLVKVHHRMA